jgi:hypothetical protein
MRFKNFSKEPIEYSCATENWVFPASPGQFIDIRKQALVMPGEVTTDFDPDDPVVQLMLKAHPDLRPLVTLSRWEWLRNPAF